MNAPGGSWEIRDCDAVLWAVRKVVPGFLTDTGATVAIDYERKVLTITLSPYLPRWSARNLLNVVESALNAEGFAGGLWPDHIDPALYESTKDTLNDLLCYCPEYRTIVRVGVRKA